MPRLSTTLQHSVGRRKQLVLGVGQPEQMRSIRLQAASPDLAGWKLGREYHHVQEAAPVRARVQWNKWACFFCHSFRSCYMAGFLSLAFFTALHQVPRGFQEEMGFLLQSFGSHCQSPFSGWISSITGVYDHEKIGLQWSNTEVWLLWVRGVCSPAGGTWPQASTSPHETPKRKERALASIKLRGTQKLSFSSNWKQVVSVLNHRSVLFLELSNLDASETTVSGPWSSLKFSVICLCDLIVDKGVALRRPPEVELPGPVAMQELPVKGKSLEGEEEKLLSSYQIAVQIDWYRQKIF